MKHTLILTSIVLLLIQCAPQRALIELKDYKSVEDVKIGMKINSAIEWANKKYYVEKTEIPAYEGEDKEYEYTVYPDDSKSTVLFSFNAGYDNQTKEQVFRIVIKNAKYHTSDGIFIGMTVKDLKEKTRLKSANFNFDDGFFVASASFDGGFIMDISTIKDKKYNYEEPQISTLPEELKIKAIVIF
jgi:hypothetical protein